MKSAGEKGQVGGSKFCVTWRGQSHQISHKRQSCPFVTSSNNFVQFSVIDWIRILLRPKYTIHFPIYIYSHHYLIVLLNYIITWSSAWECGIKLIGLDIATIYKSVLFSVGTWGKLINGKFISMYMDFCLCIFYRVWQR